MRTLIYRFAETEKSRFFASLRMTNQSINFRSDLHAEIYSNSRMRKRANRNIVHAGKPIFTDVLNRNAARGFDRNFKAALAHNTDCFLYFSGSHVVEQQRFGAMVECFFQFSKGAYFDIDGLPRFAQLVRTLQNFFDAATK